MFQLFFFFSIRISKHYSIKYKDFPFSHCVTWGSFSKISLIYIYIHIYIYIYFIILTFILFHLSIFVCVYVNAIDFYFFYVLLYSKFYGLWVLQISLFSLQHFLDILGVFGLENKFRVSFSVKKCWILKLNLLVSLGELTSSPYWVFQIMNNIHFSIYLYHI